MQQIKTHITRSLAAILLATCLLGCGKKKMRQGSASMEPVIKKDEVIQVDLKAYTSSAPARWDVVVFEAPTGGGNWAARIAALPGETVDIQPGKLLIDGVAQSPPAHLGIASYQMPKGGPAPGLPGPVSFPYKVPAGSYFVLGDNVSNALDSRYWGGLDAKKIQGRVVGR